MRKTGFQRRDVLLGAALLCGGFAGPALSQARSRVKIAKGNDNAAVTGTIRGQEYHDYLLGAKAGQAMGVSLIAEGSAYFNILPPGSEGEAIYNSSVMGNDAVNVPLPTSGDYTVRVYLMGAAEDEGRTVGYTLSMAIM
jgi:hypothetical protein